MNQSSANFSNKRGHFYGVHAAINFPDLFDEIVSNGECITYKEALYELEAGLAAKWVFDDVKKLVDNPNFEKAIKASLRHFGYDDRASVVEGSINWIQQKLREQSAAKTAHDFIKEHEHYFPALAEVDEPCYIWEQENMTLQIGYLGGAAHIWVIDSEYVTYARPCSPCIPGAGDLDNCTDINGGQPYLCLHPDEYADVDTDLVPEVVAKLRSIEVWRKKGGELMHEAPPPKGEIREYYEGTGCNATDTIKWLQSQNHQGFDISFDDSLCVADCGDFIVVLGSMCGLHFYDVQQELASV